MTRHLARDVAFRHYEAFTILVKSSTALLARLNPAAGRIVEALAAGHDDLAPAARPLLAEFMRLGIVPADDAASETEVSHKPPRPPVLLDSLNEWASDHLVPLHAHIELTHRCPLQCRHCYLAGARLPQAEELSQAEIVTILDDLQTLGTLFLTFSGGEPFMRTDLEALVEAARMRRFAVALLTSGQGATEARLRDMAELGLDGLQVSLYGSDAATHEATTRVAGSYAQAWRTLTCARELGIPVRAAVVLHKGNLADLPRLAAQLAERRIIWSPVTRLYARRADGAPCGLDPLDREELRRALPFLPPRTRFRMAGSSPESPPCHAARAALSIGPTGEVTPCPAWPRSAGSLRGERLTTLWREAPLFAAIRSYRLSDLEVCAECRRRATCNRCPGLAVQSGLSPSAHSPLDCEWAEVYADDVMGFSEKEQDDERGNDPSYRQ